MSPMLRSLTAVLFVTCTQAAPAAQVGDEQTLSLVVQARARGCAGHAGTREPLRWSDAVVRATARIDRGETPLVALQKEGYRATRVFHANFAGYRTPAEVADAFAGHYCSALTEARFSDFGFLHKGTHWLLVLATPLDVPQLADRRAALARVLALTNEARAQARRCGDKEFDAA